MNIIMKHASVYNRCNVFAYTSTLSAPKQQDYMLEQIDFECLGS